MTDERPLTEHEQFVREQALKTHERHLTNMSSTNTSVMDAGVVAVRALFLINGGSAVAILAFMASVLTGTQNLSIEGVLEALVCFAIGVALACTAACGTYLVNYCYVASMAKDRMIWDYPFVEETPASKRWSGIGKALHLFTVAVAFGSLAAFLMGVYGLVEALEPVI